MMEEMRRLFDVFKSLYAERKQCENVLKKYVPAIDGLHNTDLLDAELMNVVQKSEVKRLLIPGHEERVGEA